MKWSVGMGDAHIEQLPGSPPGSSRFANVDPRIIDCFADHVRQANQVRRLAMMVTLRKEWKLVTGTRCISNDTCLSPVSEKCAEGTRTYNGRKCQRGDL